MRSSMAGVALLVCVASVPLSACKKVAGVAPVGTHLTKAPPVGGGAPPASSAPMLAYTYRFEIEAPADGITAVSRRQEQACAAAGAQVCQVVGSNLSRQGGDVSGKLELKAAPSWVSDFRGRLDAEVQGVGGKVLSQEVSSEDLSRSIVDTGAALRAKTMLRDRLEKLLADRPGKLSELLDLEKNIADVQGDIDTTQSELAAMQGRVQMSDLALEFRSKTGVIGTGAAATLGQAFGGFLGNTVSVLAILVTLVSYVLPLALAGALGWWVLGSFRRRRPTKPAPPK